MAKKLSEMTDEERYGKVGAEIRRLDPEAYKNRPRSAEGNLNLLKELRKRKADLEEKVEIKSKRPDFTEIYERDTVTDKTGAGQRGPSARRSGMKTYTVSANKPSAAEEDVGGRRRFMAPGARREREKERSEVMNFRKGGSVKSSASRRADGIAKKGKTRGKMV
jgi:hypothetical protein